jgi:hypothetical protein
MKNSYAKENDHNISFSNYFNLMNIEYSQAHLKHFN